MTEEATAWVGMTEYSKYASCPYDAVHIERTDDGDVEVFLDPKVEAFIRANFPFSSPLSK